MKRSMYNILGFAMAGIFIMSVWGEIYQQMGLLGGLIASGLIVGLFWNINHKMQLIKNDDAKTFIDMAIGVAVAGIFRDFLAFGGNGLISSLPTLFLVLIGGAIGGTLAYHLPEK